MILTPFTITFSASGQGTQTQQLSSTGVACTYVTLRAGEESGDILYGNSAAQLMRLTATDPPITLPLSDLSLAYVKGHDGDTLTVLPYLVGM